MGLRDDIRSASMSPPVARRFAEALREVAAADGHVDDSELGAIASMIETSHGRPIEPAPLEALWPHRELLIRAAIYVAVIDGVYDVEEARKISSLAHKLGLSAHALAVVERAAFEELRALASGQR